MRGLKYIGMVIRIFSKRKLIFFLPFNKIFFLIFSVNYLICKYDDGDRCKKISFLSKISKVFTSIFIYEVSLYIL